MQVFIIISRKGMLTNARLTAHDQKHRVRGWFGADFCAHPRPPSAFCAVAEGLGRSAFREPRGSREHSVRLLIKSSSVKIRARVQGDLPL